MEWFRGSWKCRRKVWTQVKERFCSRKSSCSQKSEAHQRGWRVNPLCYHCPSRPISSRLFCRRRIHARFEPFVSAIHCTWFNICSPTGTFVDYVEPLKVAFREKRCIIRELTYDSSKSGGVDAAIREAKQDLAQTKTTVLQWCRAHFGEVYNAWLHLKVIQAFVESVLRYGLPIDFVSFFVSPDPKFDKDLKSQLLRSVLSLRPELRPRKALADEEEEEGDSADALPYVYVKFALVGGVAPASS